MDLATSAVTSSDDTSTDFGPATFAHPPADAPSPASRRAKNEHRPAAIELRLNVVDVDVLAELYRLKAPEDRTAYALNAIRIGVLALRSAAGQLDAAAMKEAGAKLLSDVKELLTARGQELTGALAQSLSSYLDPKTGALQERFQGILRKDGELDRLLQAHVGGEDSVLAKSLARHLGEGSPIFKLLSPTDATGLKAQVERTLEGALAAQRTEILKQFSLDAKDSALSRLVNELKARQAELTSELKGQVGEVVREFSLDNEDGALTRLVAQVDRAQKRIADEFTTENEQSALSKMSKLLAQANDHIEKNLTLDDEESALFRMKRELMGSLSEMQKRNTDFQQAVLLAVESLQKKRQHDAKTPEHGKTFEAALGEYLAKEAGSAGDVLEATGATPGTIKHKKAGDFVLTLSEESQAPGARIVFEAKDKAGVTMKAALQELEEALTNREAQIGVFVYGKAVAPDGVPTFSRYGSRILVVWDAEDTSTDVFLKAAISTCRALAVAETKEKAELSDAVDVIQKATRAVEKQAENLEQLKTWAETSRSSAEKIIDRVEKMRTDFTRQVEALDEAVAALKSSQG
ncbi:hypothetical protein LXT21_42300 [Myxococcus sp. K38C18041901]|uniref:hypothetical protein n=1 Tax=Myxococcus guangdongensis TaxID=2906760 RepID=UPI0020A74DBA|nr:hypothetical protein [Myxococcus guangdongensis]MCP3065418.1 hypothetical protein [Myxococcus guangdongensis]